MPTLKGGGDTKTLPTVIDFILTFCTHRQWGHLQHQSPRSILSYALPQRVLCYALPQSVVHYALPLPESIA